MKYFKSSIRTAARYAAPLSALWIFILLSCGAKHASPAKAGDLPKVGDHYVDTSQYAMHVTYSGWSGDTARALNNLRGQLQQIMDGRELRSVLSSVRVVLFDQNNAVHDLYAKDPNLSVLPASVEKMFTSSSTIWALGSHYAFTTKVDLAPGASIQGNRIIGNVFVRPSGDPTLRSSDLDDLVSQLRSKGVTVLQGDIISDLGGEEGLSDQAKQYLASRNTPQMSAHDSVINEAGQLAGIDSSAPSMDQEDEQSDPGSLSAYPNFALDRNIISVTVRGGSGKGAPLAVQVYPPISSVVIRNSGSTSAAATISTRTVGRGRHKHKVSVRSRTTTTLRVSSDGGPTDPQQTIAISGVLPARQQRTYSFPVHNVPMAMAAVLKWKMQQGGIQVTGQPRVDKAPPNTALKNIAIKQTSLIDLLTQMNKRSDNYLAETMFRKLSTIASVAASAPDERARTLMRSWLQVCNVDGSSCTFIDGSGLSKENRTTANTVINLLTAIRQQGMFELFTHTLSIAGVDGTLRHRMIGTPAQFNAHGKTGTLNGVTALAGYVITRDGQLAAYFITMQKYRGGLYTFHNDQDRIVELLANFKYSDYQSSAPMPSFMDTGALTKK